jgi:molybdopterin-guanine dinucleotide biosynthesis protein A
MSQARQAMTESVDAKAHDMTGGLVVAVLAGGEGRRMGGQKALRPFRGTPLVAHAAALARRWSCEIAVVVRNPAQVADTVEAPLVLDDPQIPGPLAGLAAALAYARERGASLLLTLPCDMPNLPEDLAARLTASLAPQDGGAMPTADGELQPVCGLWRVDALDRLPAYLAAGRTSLRGFAEVCGLATVDFGADAAHAFANANTPDELDRLAGESP